MLLGKPKDSFTHFRSHSFPVKVSVTQLCSVEVTLGVPYSTENSSLGGKRKGPRKNDLKNDAGKTYNRRRRSIDQSVSVNCASKCKRLQGNFRYLSQSRRLSRLRFPVTNNFCVYESTTKAAIRYFSHKPIAKHQLNIHQINIH